MLQKNILVSNVNPKLLLLLWLSPFLVKQTLTLGCSFMVLPKNQLEIHVVRRWWKHNGWFSLTISMRYVCHFKFPVKKGVFKWGKNGSICKAASVRRPLRFFYSPAIAAAGSLIQDLWYCYSFWYKIRNRAFTRNLHKRTVGGCEMYVLLGMQSKLTPPGGQ